ncbi:MAG: elongation factor P [Armatimonadetes bacterium]|nr:elongation factor P [Armatimonadota bacterium]
MDTSDFKNGLAFTLDGEIYQIIDFQHVKPGKGGAFVRTKLRRMRTGGTIDKTFRSGEKVDPIYIEKVNYQYLYRQGSELVLMDLDSYEQIPVPETQIGDGAKYLKEEMEIMALVAGDEVLGYEVPNFVELVVEQTDPAHKGDTVGGGATKPATLETGATVQVPFHIKEGDIIKVDTRSGDYLERVKS